MTLACLLCGRQRSRSSSGGGLTATNVLIALNAIVYAFQTRYPAITKAGWKVRRRIDALSGKSCCPWDLDEGKRAKTLPELRWMLEYGPYVVCHARTPVARAERRLPCSEG